MHCSRLTDRKPQRRGPSGARNRAGRLGHAGIMLCLPVLLAAAPEPTPSTPAKPPMQVVERVPPDRVIAILGGTVSAQDGKVLGRLIDVLVDDTGKPEAAVIDVGGFMGLGARKIAVHWSTLHFAPADPKQAITLDLTLDQIKAAPEYKGAGRPAPVVEPAPPPPSAATVTAAPPPPAATVMTAPPPPAAATVTAPQVTARPAEPASPAGR